MAAAAKAYRLLGMQVPATYRLGIALSGGGSRAMAFHLGCLRTLHRLGILENAKVLATVSGGSVIGAMYASRAGTFEDFEAKVTSTLRAGFTRSALWTAVSTLEGGRALCAFIRLLVTGFFLTALRIIRVIPAQTMPRRSASRTTILRRTFDRLLFQGKTMGDLAYGLPKLVVIATELRTKTAFYFGTKDGGSWRVGKMDSTEIPIAHAVMASAAYPLFLPALDEAFNFRKRDGSLSLERVTLTDGGVYDNLAVAPLWPDRIPEVSINVEPLDVIIACRAGYGARTGAPSIFMKSRMTAVFNTTSARAENAATKRLFDLKAAGILKHMALPYLDQDDDTLKFAPPDLVRRTSVADYPTDFSAMTEEWITKLSRRGEQVTLAVIREHSPELLPPGWSDGEAGTLVSLETASTQSQQRSNIQ